MRKQLLRSLFTAMTACFVLAGCSGKPADTPSNGGTAAPPAVTGNPSPKPAETTAPPAKDMETASPVPKEELVELGEKELYVEEDMGAFYYAGDGKLFFTFEDTAKLIDANSLEVLKSAEYTNEGLNFSDLHSPKKLYPTGQGYLFIANHQMIEFDKDLKIVQDMDLNMELGMSREWNHFLPIEDGQKLVYYNGTSHDLCLYDFKAKTKTTLVNCKDLVDMAYLKDTGRLLLRVTKNTQATLALFTPQEGQTPEEIASKGIGTMYAFDGFAIFRDIPVGLVPKTIYRYDPADGLQSFTPYQEDMETQNINPSFDGEYFLTGARTKGVGVKIRIYSSKDGKLLSEVDLSSEEFGEEFIVKKAWIYEEKKRFVLALQHWKGHDEGIWLLSQPLSNVL